MKLDWRLWAVVQMGEIRGRRQVSLAAWGWMSVLHVESKLDWHDQEYLSGQHPQYLLEEAARWSKMNVCSNMDTNRSNVVGLTEYIVFSNMLSTFCVLMIIGTHEIELMV